MTMKVACHDFNWLPWAKRTGWRPDLERVLDEVVAAGYLGVEFSGHPMELEDLERTKRLLAKFDLALVGMSFTFADMVERTMQEMKERARILADLGGRKVVLFDGTDWNSAKGKGPYSSTVELADGFAEFAATLGLDTVIHNHLRTNVETAAQIDAILPRLKRCGFCLDTGHLIAAGGDPAACARKYAALTRHVHFKDCLLKPDGTIAEFIELGAGNHSYSLTAVLDELKAAGYDGWLSLEQDSTRTTPLESARANRAYLKERGI